MGGLPSRESSDPTNKSLIFYWQGFSEVSQPAADEETGERSRKTVNILPLSIKVLGSTKRQ
ncbi:MAG: hypothetical protein ACTS73_08470 [Arsenophonus sp. NEOnobi-MAG3]